MFNVCKKVCKSDEKFKSIEFVGLVQNRVPRDAFLTRTPSLTVLYKLVFGSTTVLLVSHYKRVVALQASRQASKKVRAQLGKRACKRVTFSC